MEKTYAELSSEDQHLLREARRMMPSAYAPYSGVHVGASARTKSGKIYGGSNMENASYGLTTCAEVAALSAAVSSDDFNVEAIAIVGTLNDQSHESELITPCGRCRQLIAEAGLVSGVDVKVLAGDSELSRVLVGTISEFLPYAFQLEKMDGLAFAGITEGEEQRMVREKEQKAAETGTEGLTTQAGTE